MDETLEDEIDASWADDEPEEVHEDGEPELLPDELEEANRLADQTEMDRLESVGVFENISQDEIGDSVVLTCRFVYDWRRDHLTQQWCRRSRLVSREFRYNDPRRTDLFASALPPYAAKVLVSWGLANGYSFATADISDAFLMVKQTVPTVVRLPGTERWARLHRLLPGQRAAAHDWSCHFGAILQKKNMVPSIPCPALFTGDGLAVAVHVDALMLAGKEQAIKELLRHLEFEELKVKSSGPFRAGDSFFFLKREFHLHGEEREPASYVTVNANSKYKKKLEEWMEQRLHGRSVKKRKTPLPTGYIPLPVRDPVPEGCELCAEDVEQFQKATGLMPYIMIDRPDLHFCLKCQSRKMSRPDAMDLKALEHAVSYAICNWDIGAMIVNNPPGTSLLDLNQLDEEPQYAFLKNEDKNLGMSQETIEVFCDSDWAADRHVRKSCSGAVVCLNGSVMTYYSRSQKCVSTSSAEAEFVAAAGALQEAIGVQRIFDSLKGNVQDDGELTVDQSRSSKRSMLVLRTDSSAAKAIMCRVGTGKLKHIAISLSWVQSWVQQRRVLIKSVGTLVNPADLCTKVQFLLGLMKTVRFADGQIERVGREEMYEEMAKQDKKLTFKEALSILRVNNAAIMMPEVKRIARVITFLTTPTVAIGAGEGNFAVDNMREHGDGMFMWFVVFCIFFAVTSMTISMCALLYWIYQKIASRKIIITEMCDSSSDEKEKQKEKEDEPEIQIPLPQPKMQYLYPKVHFLERNAGQQLGYETVFVTRTGGFYHKVHCKWLCNREAWEVL